jgi:hypothetical protein
MNESPPATRNRPDYPDAWRIGFPRYHATAAAHRSPGSSADAHDYRRTLVGGGEQPQNFRVGPGSREALRDFDGAAIAGEGGLMMTEIR